MGIEHEIHRFLVAKRKRVSTDQPIAEFIEDLMSRTTAYMEENPKDPKQEEPGGFTLGRIAYLINGDFGSFLEDDVKVSDISGIFTPSFRGSVDHREQVVTASIWRKVYDDANDRERVGITKAMRSLNSHDRTYDGHEIRTIGDLRSIPEDKLRMSGIGTSLAHFLKIAFAKTPTGGAS
jgi:hypothetical protein